MTEVLELQQATLHRRSGGLDRRTIAIVVGRYVAAALAGVVLGTAVAWTLGWGTPPPARSCTTTQWPDGRTRIVCHAEGRPVVDTGVDQAA